MMPLLWVVLWSTLPPLALSSGPDRCIVPESNDAQNGSLLLQSLECHNNYHSHVHCKWRQHGNTPLQLWFTDEDGSELCVPYSPPVQDEHRTVQCKYNTSAFGIGIKHTVFFLRNETLTACSSVPHQPWRLSQQLRARTPLGLSTHDAGDGGRRLSWSNPYPSSSTLNRNLTYQLSYRAQTHDNWSTLGVTNTSVKLEKQSLRLGHRYKARVRARASVGQWSDWSPVVTWTTPDDTGQIPSLHCVLEGEKEVMCSWEVSRELAHFITYQLACRQNRTAPSERCCEKPNISSETSGTVLTYSCSLTVADPAHLLLELLPAHSTKSFWAHKHIRPNPPQQLKVREKDCNSIAEWTKPSKHSSLKLYYQVCCYKTQEEGCSILLNVSQDSVTLPRTSAARSQRYQVRVRSLVFLGEGSEYEGIPSEWTDPVDWISPAATWSLATLVYVLSSVFVVAVFFTLYCTIPACRRKVIVWVDSVPSPGKSKILSELKSATSQTFTQSEDLSISKEQNYDTISTCSLWPSTDTDKKHLETNESFWSSGNLLVSPEKVNSSETSSLSFSGPYIFCQVSESSNNSVGVKREEKQKEEPNISDDSPSPVNFAFYGEGYVCLPNRSVSRSTQELVSHSDASTNTRRDDSVEKHQQCPDTTLHVEPDVSEDTSKDEPPPYTSETFSPWVQGGAIHASGYFHLPPPT
ncbi:interleukin-3 receptor class 2 subunit beta-like [Seriola lalandi dorsalis]|uniref:interleukin-3 receptor class 2 subunit beta-like n=1 Tax=Seriola lalandi dorsalis TaxID=1841481 RepID=UPI000C6FC51E|nr:interleukin-3 receptor class 2 subunit beta-like [Seriola lalandi dorsalis]